MFLLNWISFSIFLILIKSLILIKLQIFINDAVGGKLTERVEHILLQARSTQICNSAVKLINRD